jgi:hypothetical protein
MKIVFNLAILSKTTSAYTASYKSLIRIAFAGVP